MQKLTKTEAGKVTRWGFMMPEAYDYCGGSMCALAMANGGQYALMRPHVEQSALHLPEVP